MKKRVTFLGTMVLTLAVGVLIGQIGSASSGTTPGSADDPIVTKSYVDQAIAKLGSGGGATTPATPPPPTSGSTVPVAGVDTFVAVQVPAGKTLKGGEGAEMILRSGSATVVASENGGITDITGGKDLPQGQAVEKNHMLLIPRNDGRGLKVGDYQAFVMVRGTYTIQ
jgi:hypothetical protein